MRAPRARVADLVRFSWVDGPGNRFVLFLQGCNLNCLACHNPQTIPLESAHAADYSVDQMLAQIRRSMPYISGVTVSGGEATLQHEYVGALFAAIRADEELGGLTTFIDSNGMADESVWRALAAVTDGVMVDLKVLDGERHRELTGEPNGRVLESIRHLAAAGLLYEVRLLLVPGQNDSDEELRATAEWLLGVDPGIRVKVNTFMTHGVRAVARHWDEPDERDRERYRRTLLAAGVRELV